MHLSTGPESVEAGLKTLRPAVQYLSGILPVEEGDVAPLTCMHNTVRIRFDLDEAEYISLARPDASFPQIQVRASLYSHSLLLLSLYEVKRPEECR